MLVVARSFGSTGPLDEEKIQYNNLLECLSGCVLGTLPGAKKSRAGLQLPGIRDPARDGHHAISPFRRCPMKRRSVVVAAALATLLMAIPTQSQAFFFSFGFGGGGWGGWNGWGGPGWWGWHRPYYGGWHRPSIGAGTGPTTGLGDTRVIGAIPLGPCLPIQS